MILLDHEADVAVDSREIVETWQYHDNFEQFFTKIIKKKQKIKLEKNLVLIK